MLLREQVPLAPLTTFGIGGPARWLAEADSEDSLVEAVSFARERNLPLFVLGGGSNVLAADEGYAGLVLRIALCGIRKDGNRFLVGAGEDWDAFVSHAVAHGFGGVECLAGIPGTVGGTPVQNVGAYGQEVSDTIVSVRVLDRKSLAFSELPAQACGFSYRRSIFNSSHQHRYIVTRVEYRLRSGSCPVISYPDLKRYFQDRSRPPGLEEAAAAVREIRHGKGMLLVPGEADCRSAGSFFKNPVVAESRYEEVCAVAGYAAPRFTAARGFVKIPAAWLLEESGLHRGYVMGNAGISSRHTLALINRGGATAKDILALRDWIVAAVEKKFGIRLHPEPVWLG
ncbi:MAG TPA: UDP-N-acetylmuramate dehydrogenase [Acidobacteriaceae bacterium]|nr:UDP-N-acetylmuramate dehydrogenase [Acidobacteriaceae bacterium]